MREILSYKCKRFCTLPRYAHPLLANSRLLSKLRTFLDLPTDQRYICLFVVNRKDSKYRMKNKVVSSTKKKRSRCFAPCYLCLSLPVAPRRSNYDCIFIDDCRPFRISLFFLRPKAPPLSLTLLLTSSLYPLLPFPLPLYFYPCPCV